MGIEKHIDPALLTEENWELRDVVRLGFMGLCCLKPVYRQTTDHVWATTS